MGKYLNEIAKAAKEKDNAKVWLMCFIANIAPSYEQYEIWHKETYGKKLTKTEYDRICKTMNKIGV